ncbi:hypothetical protein MFLAVUS_010316 [Mucor flavus]|uniref:Uncharacterized protein n=1 Tax=Mucor flavus TaxID=439312 RepID=A0ABP9ZCD1_9FUNG
MPTADYYTRHYLTAMTILWSSTFSMSVLFFPKVYKLFVVVAKDEDMLRDEPKSIDHVLDILGENSGTVYSGKQGTFLLDRYQKKRDTSPTVFDYSHATVESNISGSHVFRVHGSPGFYDLLIQVENEIELYKWCRQFKRSFSLPL